MIDRMADNRVAPLVGREVLGGGYFLLTFRHRATAREAQAGQFVMIKAGTSAELPLRRPFSIMTTDPGHETFTLFVKAIGPGSRALCELPVDGPAQCLGPLGRPFSPPAPGVEALMIAGGYGVAPFLMMSAEIARHGGRGRIFYGGRAAADLPLLGRLEGAGVPVTPATEDGGVGHHGRVTGAVIERLDADPGPVRLYACGPDAMLHAVARLAAERGLGAEVSLDPWMGCGVGTCLSCVVRVQGRDETRPKYRCACTEGPVFDAARVVWPGDTVSREHAGAPA